MQATRVSRAAGEHLRAALFCLAPPVMYRTVLAEQGKSCHVAAGLRPPKPPLRCRRMQEVKQSEQRVTVMDLMYASVLAKFLEIGVEMLPRLDEPAPPCNLKVGLSHSWSQLC